MCRVRSLGLLLLSWSLICWVAMGESSDLCLSQSPHVVGLVFCNMWRSLVGSRSWLALVIWDGDLECKVKITSA